MSEWITADNIGPLEGITSKAVRKRISAGKYPRIREAGSPGGKSGRRFEVHISSLSPEAQQAYIKNMEEKQLIPLLNHLHPAVRLTAMDIINGDAAFLPSLYKGRECMSLPETGMDAAHLKDPRVKRLATLVQEAACPPEGVKKRAWVKTVAAKGEISAASLYRHIKAYKKQGLAGLVHKNRKSNRGNLRKWDAEALDFWCGLCLKRAHRKRSKDALYDILQDEAKARGWKIGGYRSALKYARKMLTPALTAYQKGGLRGLDNALPPVLRKYNDLLPFEILVGDQHRFDFWVIDDDTGEVFRPEGYLWQDLRTRAWYGAAVGRKYNSYLIGLALRMGLSVYGAFGSIYTDHGKPELSNYITNILDSMQSLGLRVQESVDGENGDINGDPEEINPLVTIPGTHRKAIVRNAKAKMIESSFSFLEEILRDHFHVPGTVKTLGGEQEENSVDQAEIDRLAKAGRLLTFREFLKVLFQALDYYNQKRPHRGLIKEWAWMPKPKSATPFDCLKKCFNAGEWSPAWLKQGDIDAIFMAQADRGGRIVDRGRISFRHGPVYHYEHDDLLKHSGQRVIVRYDEINPSFVLCYTQADEFICKATPVVYSSMKDGELAGGLIRKKRQTRKQVIEEYNRLCLNVPDYINQGDKAPEERPRAITGKGRVLALEEARAKTRTREEIEAEAARIKAAMEKERTERNQIELAESAQTQEAAEMLSKEAEEMEEKPVWLNDTDRYIDLFYRLLDGEPLTEEEQAWKAEQESKMDAETIDYYKDLAESLKIANA